MYQITLYISPRGYQLVPHMLNHYKLHIPENGAVLLVLGDDDDVSNDYVKISDNSGERVSWDISAHVRSPVTVEGNCLWFSTTVKRVILGVDPDETIDEFLDRQLS